MTFTADRVLREVLEGRKEWRAVRGVSCRENGRVFHRPPAGSLTDLDALPFPDRSLIEGE